MSFFKKQLSSTTAAVVRVVAYPSFVTHSVFLFPAKWNPLEAWVLALYHQGIAENMERNDTNNTKVVHIHQN